MITADSANRSKLTSQLEAKLSRSLWVKFKFDVSFGISVFSPRIFSRTLFQPAQHVSTRYLTKITKRTTFLCFISLFQTFLVSLWVQKLLGGVSLTSQGQLEGAKDRSVSNFTARLLSLEQPGTTICKRLNQSEDVTLIQDCEQDFNSSVAHQIHSVHNKLTKMSHNEVKLERAVY